MARRTIYTNMYDSVASMFENKFDHRARSSIEFAIISAEESAKRGLRRRNYNNKKAEAIECIASHYIEGLTEILDDNRLAKNDPDFHWAVQRYGKAFSLGTQPPANGFEYRSGEIMPGLIALELVPRTIRQHRFIVTYEGAVKQNLIEPLAGVDTLFEDHKDASGKTFRKLVMELPW
ncbi:hypothetical protein ACFL3V_00065 [Nanoarchaeota archaeon]